MRKNLIAILVSVVFVFTACSSQKKLESDDDFSVDAENSTSAGGKAANDDLSLESLDDTEKVKVKEAPQDTDLALENELNSLDTNMNEKNGTSKPNDETANRDELSLDEPDQNQTVAEAKAQDAKAQEVSTPEQLNLNNEPPQVTENPTVLAESTPSAIVEPPAVALDSKTPQVAAENITINSVQYKANSNGGTIAISTDKPVTFTTRMNSTTNQFIVEVQNSTIAKKLKRSLNTKDMASSIGSVDIYQKQGSNISRFVVQLRAGAADPIVQQEGNSLLIIGSGNAANASKKNIEDTENAQLTSESPVAATVPSNENNRNSYEETESAALEPKTVVLSAGNKSASDTQGAVSTSAQSGILSYETLDQFLMSNTKYYGKKISIETSGMEVTDALKFLSEESGVNIMFDDSIATAGKVNIKLKEVPWDQAFVLILKSKKLVYKRQGNVIRVATLADIKKDEDEAIAMKEARKVPEAAAVKRYFIAYAELDDVKTKIEDYLKVLNAAANLGKPAGELPATVGKVLVDKRNNSLIITDTESNLKKIEDIITALDTQPKQILIEAKVVVAQENFSKGLGVSWESGPNSASSPNKGKLGISQTVPTTKGGTLGFTWGQIDFLGSLSASLALGEQQNQVKVLSSPRITVVSNTKATIVSSVDVNVKKIITNPQTGAGQESAEVKPVGINFGVTPIATNQGTVNLKLDINRSAKIADSTGQSTAQTELFVRSGTTAVVGGIYESTIIEASGGVPGLRNIPVIGSLFESSQKDRSKSELMIFVTPTILKPL